MRCGRRVSSVCREPDGSLKLTHTRAQVEDALRLTVKRSLSLLYRAIMGDKNTEVQPLFLVYVVLERGSVEFQPRLEELIEIVSRISGVASSRADSSPCRQVSPL